MEDTVMVPQRLIEQAFVFDVLADYGPEKVLDVGTGTRSSLPAMLHECQIEMVCIDEMKNYWGHEVGNRYFPITKDDILKPSKGLVERAPFGAVLCICTLEHIMDHEKAVKNMVDMLRPGGVLILTFPYGEKYCTDIYKELGRPKKYPVQIFSDEEMDSWANNNPIKIARMETSQHWVDGQWGATTRHRIVDRKSSVVDFCCLALEKER